MDFLNSEIQSFQNDLNDLRYFTLINPMAELSDRKFLRMYRYSKGNKQRICELLKSGLEVGKRGCGISVDIQVMAVIRYWGHHEIQDDCADIHGMSQQTLSQLCKNVVIALARKALNFIKMPTTLEEQRIVINEFSAFLQ